MDNKLVLNQSLANIRDGFNEFHDEYAFRVLYVRSNIYVRCSCWTERESSGKSNCTLCLGTGKLSFIEPIRVVQQATFTIFRTDDMTVTNMGMVSQQDKAFYTRYDCPLGIKDKIIVVGFNNEVPINVREVYEITGRKEFRLESSGRIELYGNHVELRPDLKAIAEQMIAPFRKQRTQLIDGGRYSCNPMNL